MATDAASPPATVETGEKGLKGGALGLISSIVVGVASTAPAYSLAATLGFVIVAIGLQAPIVAILAFVPMLFIAYGYKELNNADPDCGTTFTWGARAFGPKTGWFGGWGIVAADIIVMASLAQIAGQYVFLLFNAHGIGSDPSSGWVLLVGIAWIVVMTAICYVGIEISANFQKVLLSIELTMLVVLSVVALVKVGNGTAPLGHLGISWTWFDPFKIATLSDFIVGLVLMLFIYWGWDTAVSVNEETENPHTVPGSAAVASTLILLAIYVLVIISVQSYAGVGSCAASAHCSGIGLGNVANQNDVLSVLGSSIFGTSGFGSLLSHLLLLMVLSSAAASTQTTILPTARTVLAMGVYKAVPKKFAKTHRRFLTPTWATVIMGTVSIVLYVVMNYIDAEAVIKDSVDALGVWIAFYYGLTGFECIWFYRHTLGESARTLWLRGILPLLGGLILWFAMGYNLWYYYRPVNSYSHWQMTFWPNLYMGGTFVIEMLALIIGLVLMFAYRVIAPPYFKGEVLNAATPTLVPDDVGREVGLFGIDESQPGRRRRGKRPPTP